jgi:hypothetical protein
VARGWESKSVEEQQALVEERRQAAARQILSEEEAARKQQIQSLQLTRTRVMRDLAAATHDRYRQSLEAALRHVEEKIAELG